MKSIIVVAGVTGLISGCASFPGPETSAYDRGIDTQKVAAVNDAAKARGVTVLWYNYPQRKASASAVVPSLGQPTGT